MIVFGQLNYTKARWFHAIFMPVIIEFSRCIGAYLSAKFELIIKKGPFLLRRHLFLLTILRLNEMALLLKRSAEKE